MTSKKRSDRLSQYRAAIDPDDGADPRTFFQKEGFAQRTGRKSHQLCGQVADTLGQVFGGECGDEVLQALAVLSVSPAPDASQLLVQVGPLLPGVELSAGGVAAALDRAAGWLRSEVAAAVTRKRAPRLVFRFVPAAPHRPADESEVQP